VAAEYEVNIKINSQQVERELKNIDKIVSNIGKPKGGSSRKKTGIAGLLPSAEELKANERGIVRLIDRFSQRKERSITRSNTLNKKELQLNKQLTAEVRQRVRLLSQAGAKGFDGTRPQGRQLANDINARVKTQETRARLVNKINELEAKGFNVQKLRQRLSKATTEQSARRFASANKEFRLLGKTIELEKSKLRILKQQQQGFAASPVRGTATTMGSPAQIAASGRQLASPIRGGLSFPGSPLALAGRQVSRTPFGPSFPSGGAASPIRGGINFPESPIAIQAAKKTELRALKVQSSWAQALGELQETAQILKLKDARIKQSWVTALGELQETAQIFKSKDARIKQSWITALSALEDTAQIIKVRSQAASSGLTGQSSPIGGTASTPGSPAFLNRERRNKKLGQVGLGVGFPMLFGGGAGSVIGGGLGGLTGSFGAQIAFSAIGQQIDQMVASVMEAGKAFGSLSETLTFMRERSLFTSEESEELARQLESLGDVEGLAELATIELASKIGSEGIGAFQDLQVEIDEFDRLIGNLTLALQAFFAGPLAKFLDAINVTLGKQVTQGTVDRLADSLTDPAGRKKFLAKAAEEIGTEVAIARFGVAGLSASGLPKSEIALKPASMDLLSDLQKRVAGGEEFGPSTLLSRRVKITKQDRETLKLKPPKNQAAKEEAQLQKRLDRLEAERQKVLDVSRFRDKIAAASAAENEQLVVRLNGEQKIVQIEAKRKKDLAGITSQREKDAINIGAATKKLAAQRDTERELSKLQRKKQEKFENTIESLDHQLALARATTEEERERLRIEEQIRRLRQDDKLSDPQLAGIKLRMEALAEENNLANTFIRQTKEEIEKLNNPMFQLIELSKTLGNAFSESFKGIIDGSMTAQQALANLFQRTADHFLDMAAQMIAAQIKMQLFNIGLSFFGGGGGGGGFNPSAPSITGNKIGNFGGGHFAGFADGGRPPVGRPSIVGERGPELFVPGASGTIIPNHALGGGANVTVNVDASGSSVEGDAEQSKQLGKAIGIAVQQELIKQQRPGGLLG
tara:strand:+ start:1753 stop:4866 length:3114 start_codon:yes stop_codon:yes gene_type:complete